MITPREHWTVQNSKWGGNLFSPQYKSKETNFCRAFWAIVCGWSFPSQRLAHRRNWQHTCLFTNLFHVKFAFRRSLGAFLSRSRCSHDISGISSLSSMLLMMICDSILILTCADTDFDRTADFLSVRLWTWSEASRNVPGKVPNLTFHRDCKLELCM